MAEANMAQGSAVLNPTTRRDLIAGAAVLAVAGAAVPAFGADHPDAHLFALWQDYKAARAVWQPIADLYGHTSPSHPEYAARDKADEEAGARCYAIARQIDATDAKTADGLMVKLQTFTIRAGERLDDTECWTMAQDCFASIVRSVENMGGRFHG